MRIWENIKNFTRFSTPDHTEQLAPHWINEIYLDPNNGADIKLYRQIREFIATEFTKVKIVISKDLPASQNLDYILNLKPNQNQTGNEMLYEFAVGLLKGGRVYYRVIKSPKQVTSISISSVNKQGYKLFTSRQLKMKYPTHLIDQYANLLQSLSSSNTANAIELKSAFKNNDIDDPELQNTMEKRLKLMNDQIRKQGAFITNPNEEATDHSQVREPDGTALDDLKKSIYESLHISPKLLDGSYSEADYRAFYATHLQPLAGALEELLNYELVERTDYMANRRIKVILDLLQFATLESFTQMAKESLYSGYMTYGEVREALGKEPYDPQYNDAIFSNKNAVVLNNPELNSYVATGGVPQQTTDDSHETEETNENAKS